jgi:hypothetical protein
MNLLRKGAELLARLRTAHMSESVTYVRGTGPTLLSVTLPATRGRQDYEVNDGENGVRSFEAMDYIVNKVDLVLGGTVVLPKIGDRILDAGETFEVCGVPGMGHYRWCDRNRISVRIHTKKVG